MSQITRKLENNSSSTYFSRAGKASLSKFKILLDKESILKGETIHSKIRRVRSDHMLTDRPIGSLIAQELENLKNVTEI